MKASRFLAALDASLPPERLQHGRVTRARETLADATGGIGRPYIAESTLDRLLRRGDISNAQHLAGNTFSNWFGLACLDPLRAVGCGQRIDNGRSSTGAGVEHARNRVNGALDALGGLGSPCGSACWYVLGLQLTLAEWARREGWSQRPIRHESARLVLVGLTGVRSFSVVSGTAPTLQVRTVPNHRERKDRSQWLTTRTIPIPLRRQQKTSANRPAPRVGRLRQSWLFKSAKP
jgi:hypothetical protein